MNGYLIFDSVQKLMKWKYRKQENSSTILKRHFYGGTHKDLGHLEWEEPFTKLGNFLFLFLNNRRYYWCSPSNHQPTHTTSHQNKTTHVNILDYIMTLMLTVNYVPYVAPTTAINRCLAEWDELIVSFQHYSNTFQHYCSALAENSWHVLWQGISAPLLECILHSSVMLLMWSTPTMWLNSLLFATCTYFT